MHLTLLCFVVIFVEKRTLKETTQTDRADPQSPLLFLQVSGSVRGWQRRHGAVFRPTLTPTPTVQRNCARHDSRLCTDSRNSARSASRSRSCPRRTSNCRDTRCRRRYERWFGHAAQPAPARKRPIVSTGSSSQGGHSHQKTSDEQETHGTSTRLFKMRSLEIP